MSQPEPESSTMAVTRVLFKSVMKGEWEEVIDIYESDPYAKKLKITQSGYTALHMAVSNGREDIVARLVTVLKEYAKEVHEDAKGVLEMKNEEGNTPLHIAASMGNVKICELIAQVDRTLIKIKNNDGETPLFLAALHGKKDAFLRLHFLCLHDNEGISYCRRNDGNSILHCAIAGEYFDLAFQIIHLYKDLVDLINSEGNTPLHVLATKPLAFQSGSNLGRFQKMAYKFLSVDKLQVTENTHQEEKPIKNEPNPSYPQNYETLVNCFHCITLKDDAISRKHAEEKKIENPTNKETEGSGLGRQEVISRKHAEEKTIENPTNKETEGSGLDRQKGNQPALRFLPPNYVTCFEFVKVVCKSMLVLTGPGYGGVTNILDEKRKHTWSVQVLDKLLQNSNMYEREETGQAPIDNDIMQEFSKLTEDGFEIKHSEARKKDSAILIAAKHGITEIVEKILENFPIAIHDTQENKKNIVLIAVENRKLEVYKLLLRKYDQNEGMFRKVDMNGDGALHFAANHKIEHPRWPIPGDALQMQWEIKWLKFVEESKPKHFFVFYNSKGKTPDEIFTESHQDLVVGGGKWMKSTAESCSLVAALIATVAFATSTALPGGVDDQSGKPHLETKPGFQVFAIASLIALCFSVTSLVMFLAILTSRYQEKDFGRDLPWKLLLGLTSLFVSIASMLVSFCAGHFFVLEDTIRNAAFPVYALTGVPVTFFAAAQFPLYFDLIRATFKSPFGDPNQSSEFDH